MIFISYLYIVEHGAVISFSENYIKVTLKNSDTRKVPVETVESISIFSKSQMTTQCTEECLRRGIPVSYYSKSGKFFGQLMSTGHVNTQRQRKQSLLYESDFAVQFAKNIISCKINNQLTVLKRYMRNSSVDLENQIFQIKNSYKKIEYCSTIEEIMGYEGIAARYYFEGLGKLVEPEFYFQKRSRRPPKDEFNSILSLGYSILLNEIYGKIQSKGLNPYFGLVHSDREKHPTLASDLMEEWRAVIVDSLVMSLINGHEIKKEHFTLGDNGGYFLTSDGMKIFIKKFENKLKTSARYLSYVDYSVSFRRAMDLQVNQLVKAIEEENADLYKPIKIR